MFAAVRRLSPSRLRRLPVLLSLIVLAAASTSVAAQGTALPERLTDTQFWQLISTMSEPGGTFSSDNFTSNEMSIGVVSGQLLASGRTGGAYMGVGPEQNFTYIATIKPEIAFIVDIRRQAVIQHLMYKAVFELSGNRSEFISRLFSLPLQAPAAGDTSIRQLWQRYTASRGDSALFTANLAAIQQHLTTTRGLGLSAEDLNSLTYVYSAFFRMGPGISYRGSSAPGPVAAANFRTLTEVEDSAGVARSFLANEENFRTVKELHERNLIIPVVGDFGGPRALRAVGDYLRERRATVTAFYTSNVEQYLFRPNDTWREFYQNASLLPLDTTSVFIRPSLNSGGRGGTFTYRSAASIPPYYVAPATPPQQSATLGAITGIVRDSTSSSPLPSVSVVLIGTQLAATTDSAGRFVIPNTDPGVYSLMYRLSGYGMQTRTDVQSVGGVTTSVDANLSPMSPGVVTFSVTAGRSGAQTAIYSSGSNVALCPMLAFLAAWRDGRVQAYPHATSCVR